MFASIILFLALVLFGCTEPMEEYNPFLGRWKLEKYLVGYEIETSSSQSLPAIYKEGIGGVRTYSHFGFVDTMDILSYSIDPDMSSFRLRSPTTYVGSTYWRSSLYIVATQEDTTGYLQIDYLPYPTAEMFAFTVYLTDNLNYTWIPSTRTISIDPTILYGERYPSDTAFVAGSLSGAQDITEPNVKLWQYRAPYLSPDSKYELSIMENGTWATTKMDTGYWEIEQGECLLYNLTLNQYDQSFPPFRAFFIEDSLILEDIKSECGTYMDGEWVENPDCLNDIENSYVLDFGSLLSYDVKTWDYLLSESNFDASSKALADSHAGESIGYSDVD